MNRFDFRQVVPMRPLLCNDHALRIAVTQLLWIDIAGKGCVGVGRKPLDCFTKFRSLAIADVQDALTDQVSSICFSS